MTATADTELAFAGPAALAASVRAGEVTPRELVELYLRRIERLDPQLNAFRVTRPEAALEEADRIQDRDAPLAGVPIAVKDDIPFGGEVATRGSHSYGPPAPADAEVLRRLRAAGAIPIGITRAPELFIFPWTNTAAGGVTRNPWNPKRTPGGSSGGSAAAVAAGMVAAATASDGGGSIRIPAALSGLVGMKSTRGRVSSAPNRPGWLGLSVYGGLARTVADSALLLDVIHGGGADEPDPAPPFTGSYVQAAASPPGQLRIAISTKPPAPIIAPLGSDQRGAWEQTAALLSDLGHEVVDRNPDLGLVEIEFFQLWLRGIYEESQRVPEPDKMESLTRQLAGLGRRLVPPWRRDRLLARRPGTSARVMRLWDEYDVLLTPTTAVTNVAAEGGYGRPAPIALNIASRLSAFTAPYNFTGQPAITIPAGLGVDGMPLSVQLVGRIGAEDVLYSLAGQIEQAAPWAQRRPALAI
jgi:amidase